MDREKAFESADYVSQFARSGALALFDVTTRGLLDSDSVVRDRLSSAAAPACKPGQRLPHIILVLDESSFDISAVAGIKVPLGYQSHFRSFDGKERTFLVEGVIELVGLDIARLEVLGVIEVIDAKRLSLARRVPQRAQFPEDAWHRSLL